MRIFFVIALAAFVAFVPVARAQSSEVKKYMNGAITLYENLEYEKAIKQLQKARAKAAGPDDEKGIALLEGVVLADMGKDEQASKRFKEGFSVDLKAKLPVEVSPRINALAEKARASVAKLLAPLEKERAEEEKKAAEVAAAALEAQKLAEQKKSEEEVAARNRPQPPAIEKTAESSGPSLRVLSIIPAGVAVASAAVGTIFLLNANAKYNSLNSPSATPTFSPAEAAQVRDQGKQQATLGYVFSGVALAGIVTAATMFALGGSKSEDPMVSAVVTPQGGMVFLTLPHFDLMERP
jgi:tetratricopeptide (TPR) repeat protein